MIVRKILCVSALVVCVSAGCADSVRPVVAAEATVEKLAGGFRFTEGPAAHADGTIYFTDIPNNRIHTWSPGDGLATFLEDSGGANGLFFDREGTLIACAGKARRLVAVDASGQVRVLTATYRGKRLNSPNDLWIDPAGGIYFTDPRYGKRDGMQMGEHVYYLSPDGKTITRVINDFTRPNGLVGTPDGRTLYVTDRGAGQTWVYDVTDGGALENKTLFAKIGSDGMTIDTAGNIYLAAENVVVCNPDGRMIDVIDVPERPSNVCFGAGGEKRLYITARQSLYAVRTRYAGGGVDWKK